MRLQTLFGLSPTRVASYLEKKRATQESILEDLEKKMAEVNAAAKSTQSRLNDVCPFCLILFIFRPCKVLGKPKRGLSRWRHSMKRRKSRGTLLTNFPSQKYPGT